MKKFYIPEIDLYLDEFIEDKGFERDLTYDFKSVLNESDFKKLRGFVVNNLEKGGYFECFIDDEARQMRFGVVSHRETSDGFIVSGPIVEKSYDEGEHSKYGNDFDVNLENSVFKLAIVNQKLVNLLQVKGLITTEEKENVLNVTRKEILTMYFDYNTF